METKDNTYLIYFGGRKKMRNEDRELLKTFLKNQMLKRFKERGQEVSKSTIRNSIKDMTIGMHARRNYFCHLNTIFNEKEWNDFCGQGKTIFNQFYENWREVHAFGTDGEPTLFHNALIEIRDASISWWKGEIKEYPIKEMVSFSDLGDGRWRLHCELEPSLIRKMTRGMWKDLDYQINKFVEEDGRFEITWRSYDDEYALPMIVFPKTLCNSI